MIVTFTQEHDLAAASLWEDIGHVCVAKCAHFAQIDLFLFDDLVNCCAPVSNDFVDRYGFIIVPISCAFVLVASVASAFGVAAFVVASG